MMPEVIKTTMNLETMMQAIGSKIYPWSRAQSNNEFLVSEGPPYYQPYDGKRGITTQIMYDQSLLLPPSNTSTIAYRNQQYTLLLSVIKKEKEKGNLSSMRELLPLRPEIIYFPDKRIFCNASFVDESLSSKKLSENISLLLSKIATFHWVYGTFEDALAEAKEHGGFYEKIPRGPPPQF